MDSRTEDTRAAVAARSFHRFIGIDLGGGRGKNTAVARLELRGDSAQLVVAEAKTRYGQRGTGTASEEPSGAALFRDEVLVEYIQRWLDEHTVIAINAPLTLPPCVRCQLPCPGVKRCDVPAVQWMRTWAPRLLSRRSDPSKPVVTPYTQRSTEVLWTAMGVRPREALGQGTGPLAARANYLRRLLAPTLRLHENLIEVDPRATVSRLFGPERERQARLGETSSVWKARALLLNALPQGVAFDYVWPELVVRNTHVFNAVMCAYSSYLWSRHAWRGAGDVVDAMANASELAGQRVGDAAKALGDIWLEDGWIFAPARRV